MVEIPRDGLDEPEVVPVVGCAELRLEPIVPPVAGMRDVAAVRPRGNSPQVPFDPGCIEPDRAQVRQQDFVREEEIVFGRSGHRNDTPFERMRICSNECTGPVRGPVDRRVPRPGRKQ